MWGMGNRSEPSGPDETSERSLFRVLEAKNANRSGRAGSRSPGRPSLLGAQGALALCGCRGYRHRVRGDPVCLQREPGYLRLRARRQRRPQRCDDAARTTGRRCSTRAASRQELAARSPRTFVADGTGATDTGFAGGGSKDIGTSRSWGWSTGVTPAKDDIATCVCGSYVEQGNEILYFGQERVDTQAGDANMGFWFLQDPTVGPNASGGFDGKHVDGRHSHPELARRTAAASPTSTSSSGTASGLTEITGLTEGGLRRRQARHAERVRVRQHGHDHASWGADLKSPYFYEGGLNLSALFPGQALPCFSTFISNTRTSQSDDAVLKDFASGAIDTCGSIVIKKVTQPSGAAQKFDFTSDVAGDATFQLADGESRR